MASIGKALSLEINQIIDPELAYDLFWAERIQDKTQFACPGTSCGAQTTCANIDRYRHEMKQSPHFRVIGEHSPSCDIIDHDSPKTRVEITQDGGRRAHQYKDPREPDLFRLSRPASQLMPPGLAADSETTMSRSGGPSRTIVRESAGYNTYYSIGPLISKFIQYREEGVVAEKFVRIGNQKLSYKDLFTGIYNQSIGDLPRKPRIYWGLAFINRSRRGNGYTIAFGSHLRYADAEIRPTMRIFDRKLANYVLNKPLASVFHARARASEARDRRSFIFVYSKPFVSSGSGRRYINFRFKSFDHIETRSLDFFDELKKVPS